MDTAYHGIVIDVSQKDPSALGELSIIGRREAPDASWTLLKVEVKPGDLEGVIQRLQANLVEDAFYFHFYRNDELIAVFKKKIFRTKTDPSTWGELVAYGLSLGIPERQLDFRPCRAADEEY